MPDTATLNDVCDKLEEVRRILASQSAELLTREQAANYLGIGTKTLQRLAGMNVLLRPVKTERGGKRWRKRDLDAYVEKLRKV